MKFSLWNNEVEFVQASDDVNRLKTNGAQVKAWHESMGNENPLTKLTIKENGPDQVVWRADFRVGAAVRWKAAK